MRLGLAALAALALFTGPARAGDLDPAVAGTYWGEPEAALRRQLGARATVLPQPIDFGDSYVDIVLRQLPVGGFPLIVFYQMDKTTHALKRIQLERPRHSATPPAFRGVLTALEEAYGPPDLMCGIRPAPATGYQAAAERIWTRDGIVVRAIFRDTTLEAYGGCLAGPCGLTGQLLVRVSPQSGDNAACPVPPTRREMQTRPRG